MLPRSDIEWTLHSTFTIRMYRRRRDVTSHLACWNYRSKCGCYMFACVFKSALKTLFFLFDFNSAWDVDFILFFVVLFVVFRILMAHFTEFIVFSCFLFMCNYPYTALWPNWWCFLRCFINKVVLHCSLVFSPRSCLMNLISKIKFPSSSETNTKTENNIFAPIFE